MMAKFLIDKGASITKPMSQDVTLLHLAASNGDVQLLDYALEKGQHSTVNVKTKSGVTPAHHAVNFQRMDVINLLMEHGCDLSLENDGGVNVYATAIQT